MSVLDVTRVGKLNQKRSSSYFVARINAENADQFQVNDHLAFVLPANSLIVDVFAHVVTLPTTPYIIRLGNTPGGAEYFASGTPAATGKLTGAASQKFNGANQNVYLDLSIAPSDGDVVIVLEYLETDRTTGELTLKSPI